MLIDQTLSEELKKYIRVQDELNKHTSSGKISASMLGQPVQWQVLKIIGVPPKEVDDYVKGKFLRGKDVENKILALMSGLEEVQKEVEYRGAIGYVDAIVDTKSWENNLGIIPHEIKSVSNAKFKRITQREGADDNHILQACFYAMALKSKHFAIDYVSTDDYRILTYIGNTDGYSDKVDKAITDFENQMKLKKVPVFEAKQKWQATPTYNNYPTFLEMSEEQIAEEIKKYKIDWKEKYNKLTRRSNEI